MSFFAGGGGAEGPKSILSDLCVCVCVYSVARRFRSFSFVRARVCFPQRSACLGKTEEKEGEKESVFESETLKIIKLGKLKIHENKSS